MENAVIEGARGLTPPRGRGASRLLLKTCLLGLVGIGLAEGPARADLVLTFDQSNYLVDANQGFDVSVYLTESGTNILATDGLSSAGIVVSFNVPAMVSDPAQVVQITQNPGVSETDDFVSTTITPATSSQAGTAQLMFSIFLSDVLFPPSGSSSILIGTFRFAAGAVPGETTNLSVAIAGGGAQFFSGTNQDLDDLITTTTASVTVRGGGVVPEPHAILLLSSGLVPAVFLVRRKGSSSRRRLAG